MQYGILRSRDSAITLEEHETFDAALRSAGLDPAQVDHGTLAHGLAFVVFEFGLLNPPDETHHASILGTLIAGNAVLYAVDEAGDTAPLTRLPPVSFYGRGVERVERAIAARQVRRPQTSVNGRVLWRWPDRPRAR